VASAYVSCESVGGDLYDCALPEDRLLLMLADVAGTAWRRRWSPA